MLSSFMLSLYQVDSKRFKPMEVHFLVLDLTSLWTLMLGQKIFLPPLFFGLISTVIIASHLKGWRLQICGSFTSFVGVKVKWFRIILQLSEKNRMMKITFISYCLAIFQMFFYLARLLPHVSCGVNKLRQDYCS